METNERLREQKLHRLAAGLGVRLLKSRAHTWSYSNQLGYMLADARTGFLLDGEHFGLSLGYVEDWLRSYSSEQSSRQRMA